MARQKLGNGFGAIEIIQNITGAGLTHDQRLKRRMFERFAAVLRPIGSNPMSKNRVRLVKVLHVEIQ